MNSMFGSRAEVERKETHNFRIGFVLKPGFDFSALKPHCKKLVYATDGYTDELDNIRKQLEEAFQDFDPERDVLVPVGNTTACFIAGTILSRLILESGVPDAGFYMGIYGEKEYEFRRIPLASGIESYRVV